MCVIWYTRGFLQTTASVLCYCCKRSFLTSVPLWFYSVDFFFFFVGGSLVPGMSVNQEWTIKVTPVSHLQHCPWNSFPRASLLNDSNCLSVAVSRKANAMRLFFTHTHIYTHCELLVYQLQRQCGRESNQIACSSHLCKWFKQLLGFNW